MLEELADQVQAGSDASRTEIDLAGMRAGIGEKLDHGIRREQRAREEDERQGRDEGHRLEVLRDVVAELLVEAPADRQPPDLSPQEGGSNGSWSCPRLPAHRPA